MRFAILSALRQIGQEAIRRDWEELFLRAFGRRHYDEDELFWFIEELTPTWKRALV